MTLEPKHIIAYLDHRLEVVHDRCVKEVHGFMDEEIFLDYNGIGTDMDGKELCEVEPILLPLSALTEPMEDGSVPAIKLAELLIEKGIKNDIAPTIPFVAKIITKPFGKMLKVTKCDEWYLMLSFDEPARVQHVIFEKLIEWHFDVYGLIDAGLAIDKRTIK